MIVSLNGKPMVETKSGLLIVDEPPKPIPKVVPDHPSTEIQFEVDRKKAKSLLRQLYCVLGLKNGDDGGIVYPSDQVERRKLHRRLWQMFGEVLLGDDCPSQETYT